MQHFARRKLKGLEVAQFERGGRPFAPHFHDEFVLSVNLIGHEAIKLGAKTYDAAAGDVTLYNPGEVQSSPRVSERWQFLSLYASADVLKEVFDLPGDTVFCRPVLSDPAVASDLRSGIAKALAREVPEAEAEERLIGALDIALTRAGSRRERKRCRLPPEIRLVAEQLIDTEGTPTLSELAAEAGMSPVQLVRAFSKAYGLPPFAWAANWRVNEARRRLEQGAPIAQVAAELGFADQAHLTRRFRAINSVPPGRWRAG